ncbi:MAG TPA: hypothetical protein VFX15_05080 [Actinomycetes bacterium]|nr:hypothetical protein [Actinomycetes bacterium]
MSAWYQEHIADAGRSAALFLVIGFVVSYAVTRWITRRIRARGTSGAASGPMKDVYIGGVHIHHQVWGILLVLLVGLLEFRFRPESPWLEVLAFLFGVGAALALDEFALWLYVKDVYWTEEGKKSIDAVMVALVVGVALLMSTSPIGVEKSELDAQSWAAASIAIVIHFTYTIITLLKGKIVTGLLGLPIPLLSFVGSLRLAKPTSYWAKRFYSAPKMSRAEKRFGPRYRAREERLRRLMSVGTASDPESKQSH